MKSIYLIACAGVFALLLSGCAPELDQTGLSPEEKIWAENIKANYGAWEVPESVPRGVRRDDLANAQNNDAAASADNSTMVPIETVPAVQGGNDVPAAVETPAAVTTPAAEVAAPAAAESEVYTVAKGDTLGGIARKHYGKASAWKRIQEANKDVLKGKDKTIIYPGMKLQIPRP